MNQKKTEIKIPEKIAVYVDDRTKVKSVALPFVYADGINGIITVTHLTRGEFIPAQEIESIIINFKQ